MVKLILAVGGTALIASLAVVALFYGDIRNHPDLVHGALIALVIVPAATGAAVEFVVKKAKDRATSITVPLWLFLAYVMGALVMAACAIYVATTYVIDPYFPELSYSSCRNDQSCYSNVALSSQAHSKAIVVATSGIAFLICSSIAFVTRRRIRLVDKI